MMLRSTPSNKLEQLKDSVLASHDYFKSNRKRYHEYVKFVFMTSLSPDDETKLNVLQKPVIEFNILEAMISRLRGEFAKHEPDINVKAADGVRIEDLTPEFIQLIDVIESHLREILFQVSNDSLEYNLFSDILGGGYSVAKVFTDYVNNLSFDQIIKVERVFDPTLTGFDPLARESYKGDGAYCFELYPKTREEFEKEFGKGILDGMQGYRNAAVGGFNWSYKNQKQDIVMVVDYYEKVRKKEKIAKLSNGHTILKKHYKQLLEMWEAEKLIEQAPIIIEERMSFIETIERYQFCENRILSHDKTNYNHLPLVFFDGNSVVVQPSEGGATEQITRPIVYHAKGIQMLMNFAGQSLAAEIENMVQHKWIVSAEAIPDEYEDAYKNVQQASTLVYNAFYKDNPEAPLPAPREVQRTPTPPIIENTFNNAGQMAQQILGSYDSVLATNDKQVSGVSIQQGALQCNAATLPWLKGYIKGLNRVAHIILDLIPKYYVTPRSLPIRQQDGKRSYQLINHPENPMSIDMKYHPHHLNVKIEPGVSAGVQKQVALDQITRMMQASETFAHFINSMGLETILDNLDIRGIESLKAQAVEFMKKQVEAEQAAQEKGDPAAEIAMAQLETMKEIEMAKLEQQSIKAEGDHAIQSAKVAIEKQKTELKFIEIMAKIEGDTRRQDIEEEKLDSENARTAVELALKIHEHHTNREKGMY